MFSRHFVLCVKSAIGEMVANHVHQRIIAVSFVEFFCFSQFLSLGVISKRLFLLDCDFSFG